MMLTIKGRLVASEIAQYCGLDSVLKYIGI